MKTDQSGFTLVEVMIAVLIFAISLLAYLSFFNKSARERTFAAELAAGSAIVQQIVDEKLALPYAYIISDSSTVTQDQITYTCDNSFSDANMPNKLKSVHTTISWQSRSGADHTFEIESYVANLD